jgi:hypothetical protein
MEYKEPIIKQIMLMDGNFIKSSDGEITELLVNGEMTHITWYRQTMHDGMKRDINRNFVAWVDWE